MDMSHKTRAQRIANHLGPWPRKSDWKWRRWSEDEIDMKRGCLMNVGLKLPGGEGAINVYQDLRAGWKPQDMQDMGWRTSATFFAVATKFYTTRALALATVFAGLKTLLWNVDLSRFKLLNLKTR